MGLILALLALPVVEIALFIQVGALIGLWATLALVLGAAVLGVWVMRVVGFGALREVQRQMQAGQDPGAVMFDSGLKLVAGALFILPGFLTDLAALLLLLPPVRAAVIGRVRGGMTGAILWRGGMRRAAPPEHQTVEGVWQEAPPPNPRPSGWVRDPQD